MCLRLKKKPIKSDWSLVDRFECFVLFLWIYLKTCEIHRNYELDNFQFKFFIWLIITKQTVHVLSLSYDSRYFSLPFGIIHRKEFLWIHWAKHFRQFARMQRKLISLSQARLRTNFHSKKDWYYLQELCLHYIWKIHRNNVLNYFCERVNSY